MDWAEADKEAARAVADWWGTVDWGTAPDWFAAVGTVGTLAAALWQLKRERDRARAAEARERRARVLGVVVERGTDGEGDVVAASGAKVRLPMARATIHNGSDAPIHRVFWHSPSGWVAWYGGTVRAGERKEAEGLLHLFPPHYIGAEITFRDVDGHGWLLHSGGHLYPEGSPQWRELGDDPDPVTPQPNAPAPPATAQAEDPPDPGAAS